MRSPTYIPSHVVLLFSLMDNVPISDMMGKVSQVPAFPLQLAQTPVHLALSRADGHDFLDHLHSCVALSSC